MLNLTIWAFGTLHQTLDGYDTKKGLNIAVHDSSTASDLIRMLGLDNKKVGMVSMNGALIDHQTVLKDGAQIKIFQPISGG